MIAILGLASILGFFVSLVLLIISIVRKRSEKKKWTINLIVCFAVFLFCVSVPTTSTDNDKNQKQITSQKQQDLPSVQHEQKQPSTPEEPEADSNIVEIDGTLSADCFDLSILDVKWTTALETSLGTIEPDDASNGLLCIIFSAINTTDNVQNVASIGFNAYADGKKVIPKVVVGSIDDAVAFVGAVSPGLEIVGHVVWELPLDWNEFQTSYIDSGTAKDSKQHFRFAKNELM